MKLILTSVITGDIVNSTRLKKQEEKKLMNTLSSVLKNHKHMFYRGDSLQAHIAEPKEALKILLQMRSAAKSISSIADVRAAIGIGSIETPLKNLETATGEAFLLSGRKFDEISKTEKRLAMQSNNDVINLGLKVTANYTDSIFASLTVKQAAVIFELLMDRNQNEAAKTLKKSQPTINKHAQSGKWPEINNLIEDYKLFIEHLK